MTLWLGKLEVQLLQLGRGHTKGDTVVWLPQERTLLSGDLVEFDATPYAGDAYFKDWPRTLDNLAALKPLALVPGRGAALTTPESSRERARRHAQLRRRAVRQRSDRREGRQGPERGLQGHLREAEAEVRPLGDLRPLHAFRRHPRLRRGDPVSRPAHLDRRARSGDVEGARIVNRRNTDKRRLVMLIKKVHHVAYRCIDAKQTVEWYEKYLGMKFVLAIAEDEVPSTKEPDPYMHVFLDAGQGNVLAFFELPTRAPMDRDRNTPIWVQHLAWRSTLSTRCSPPRRRLQADGIEVVGPTDHTLFKSIYFFDPNGHRLELAANTATAGNAAEARRGEVRHARGMVQDEACAEARGVDARRQLVAGCGALNATGGRRHLREDHDYVECNARPEAAQLGRFRQRSRAAISRSRTCPSAASAAPAARRAGASAPRSATRCSTCGPRA